MFASGAASVAVRGHGRDPRETGVEMNRTVAALAALVAIGLMLPGCSVKKMAIKTMADALSQGGTTYTSDEDPELVKDALPFGLKTLEGLSAELPNHRPLLRSLASGFTSYAAAFLVPEIRPLEEVDLDRARELRVRARRMFLRARDYALRSLEVAHPRFREGLQADPRRTVEQATRAEVVDLYWAAAAWGSAISIGKDQMELVADVPVVEALIRRAYALDPAYDSGAIDEFLIAFESRGDAMGGSLVRAREHFDRAMRLAHGRKVGPLVSLAENVSVQQQNRKEFDELLDRALAFDPDSAPELRLVNRLAQRHARQLKALTPVLFLEERP